MINANEIKTIIQEKLKARARRALTVIEAMAQRSIKKNFEVGGRPTTWPASKKKGKNKGTKTLVISGNLSNVGASSDSETLTVTLTTNPLARAYARIHNEGGTITVPARTVLLRKKKYKDGRIRTVFASKRHKRGVTEKTAKAHVITIPKREFMVVPEEDLREMVKKIKNI